MTNATARIVNAFIQTDDEEVFRRAVVRIMSEIDDDLQELARIRTHHASVERECLQLREELAAEKKVAAAGRGEGEGWFASQCLP